MNINQSIEYQMTISTVKFVGYENASNSEYCSNAKMTSFQKMRRGTLFFRNYGKVSV
jgi:hypothetical protein